MSDNTRTHAPGEHDATRTGAGAPDPNAKPGEPQDQPGALAPPSRIGRFQVQAVLGAGHSSRVFLAFDPEMGRQVAIKQPFGEGLRPEYRADFLKEARAVAAIDQHANICPVYDVDTDEGVPYIVMRFVAGGTLKGMLERRTESLPVRTAAVIARKLAQGLAAAHARGVIHRDLKPANVLYDEANREVLITDFGLAAAGVDGSGPYGTPLYMSPEQWSSPTFGPVTALADVYALGVVLYELLTGEPPFTGTLFELMQRHCTESPIWPSMMRAGIDARLDAIVLKALEKMPSARYPSAKSFAAALADYLRGDSTAEPVALEALPLGESIEESEPQPFPSPPTPGARVQRSGALPPSAPAASRSEADLVQREVIRCPKCQRRLQIAAGRTQPVQCPMCDLTFTVDVGRQVQRRAAEPDSPASKSKPERPRPKMRTCAAPDESGEPEPASPCPITDQVHFSVTAPAAMCPGSRYALSVWAHLATHRAEVLARAREAHTLGPVQMHTKAGVRVDRGTVLTVRVVVPDFPLAASNDTDTLEWNGDACNATFPIEVPDDAPLGSHVGTALIYAAGLQIAKLHFDFLIAAVEAAPRPLKVREDRHKTAFASYASKDRKEVLARIQGIQKALPDLEIFLDVTSLRSGERWADVLEREVASRDVFYLFWSANARDSEWVEREWRAALKARGLDYIDPVPLVDPNAVPPPPELATALHFNDWVLAYLRTAEATSRGRSHQWLSVLVALLVVGATLFALALLAPLRSDK